MSSPAAPPQSKALAAPLTLPAGSAPGSVEALFSVYHTIDSVGDVVLPGAFAAGQEVPMAAWSHQWGTLPVGKGVIHDTPAGAVFKGQFFLNTEQGRATYETVKSMGGLQEWSFGFGILDSELGSFDGQPVRFLKRLETYEVSPVLVGANRNTGTLGIKTYHEPEPGQDALYEAMQGVKWRDFESLAEALADFKAGRVLSEATRRRIQAVRDQWAAQLAELDQLLADTEPAPRAAPDPDLLELRAQFADFRARHRDVIGEWGE